MKKSFKHTLLALLGVVIVWFCPGFALAQERRVADVSSAAEFADDVIEITTPVRGVPVQQVFAATWSGATRGQMDAYFRDGTPFPTPVLPRGLPTGMDIRGVGPSNWLHPGGDAVFFEAFRGQEERFTSIVDLLRENRSGAFNASVSGTWTFLRPVGTQPVLPPRIPYGIMTLRPDSRQAGVPEGQVRWVVTSYQSVYPTCEGRPAMIYSGSVLTALGRAYLSQRCEHPVDTSSIYTLFGATPPGKLFEVVPRVELRIRLMGRVRIPRSTGYRSPTETAALTIPLADVSDVELEAKPSYELKIIEDALIPACAPGVVSEDLRQAALTTEARVSIAYQHALAREERAKTAEKQAALTLTTFELRGATHRGDVNEGRATRHARERNVALAVIGLLLIAIGAVIRWGRKNKSGATSLTTQLSETREAWEKESGEIRGAGDLLFVSAQGVLKHLENDMVVEELVARAKSLIADQPEDEIDLKTRLKYAQSALQAIGMKWAGVISGSIKPTQPYRAASMPPMALDDVTPEMAIGACTFFRIITGQLFSVGRAGRDQSVRSILTDLSNLSGNEPKEVWGCLAERASAQILSELKHAAANDLLLRDVEAELHETWREYSSGGASKREIEKRLAGALSRVEVIASILHDRGRVLSVGPTKRLEQLIKERFQQNTACARTAVSTNSDTADVTE